MRVVALGPPVRFLPLDPDPALPTLRDRGRAGRRQGSRRLGAGVPPPGRPRFPGDHRAIRRSSWSTSPAVSQLAHRAGAKVIVDNVFATPLLQQPLELGADLVVYSGTKHIDGQGRCLGGLICCDTRLPQNGAPSLSAQYRPGLSPFNAWVLLKGLETLTLRVRAMSDAAARLARWLEAHARGRAGALSRPGKLPPARSGPAADEAAAARWWPFASAATGPRRSPCSTGCS